MKIRVKIIDVYEFEDTLHSLAELKRDGGVLAEEVARGYVASKPNETKELVDYFKGFSVVVSKVGP